MRLRDYVSGGTEKGTSALEALVLAYGRTFGALAIYVEFARHIDSTREIAAEALCEASTGKEAERWAQFEKKPQVTAWSRLQKLSSHNNSITYQIAYNGFSTYISSLIKLIYARQRGMLNINEKISYREAVQFTRMSDLVDYMIDKRINELSFRSIGDLREDFTSRYGFDLFPGNLRLKTISTIAERRNLLVHSNGIVNHRYLERTGDHRRRLGQEVRLGNAADLMLYLLRVAGELDARASEKFGLTRRRFKEVESFHA